MAARLILCSALRTTQTAKGTTGYWYQSTAGYAVKKAATGVKKKKKWLDTETDPERLCNYLCGANIMKEGEDPKLGNDSDYPDWLWTLRTEDKVKTLDELTPDSWEYWKRVRKMAKKRKNFLMSKYKK